MIAAWHNRWRAVLWRLATALRAALVLALVAGFPPMVSGHAARAGQLLVSDPSMAMGAGALRAHMMSAARADTCDAGLGFAPRGCADPAIAACNMHCLGQTTGPIAPVSAVMLRLVDMRLGPDPTLPPPSRTGSPPRRPPKIGA